MAGLYDQGNRSSFTGALDGAIDDLLADAGDGWRERTFDLQIVHDAVQHVFDGIPQRRLRHINRNLPAILMFARLQANGLLVVVAADRAFLANQNEAALGLWLMSPGIGEGAPAGFK